MTLSKAFAMRTCDLLVKHHMSKYRLEKETGISHSGMRHIFNEDCADIRLSTIAKVAAAFGMSLIEFFDYPAFDMEKLELED